MAESREHCENCVCTPRHRPSMCASDCCGGAGHVLLRWFLGLVVLVLIFGLGIKLGELKANLENDYWQERAYGKRTCLHMMPDKENLELKIMRRNSDWTGPTEQPPAPATP